MYSVDTNQLSETLERTESPNGSGEARDVEVIEMSTLPLAARSGVSWLGTGEEVRGGGGWCGWVS